MKAAVFCRNMLDRHHRRGQVGTELMVVAERPGPGVDVDHGHNGAPSAVGGWVCGRSGRGSRHPGRLAQQPEHLGVEPLGHVRGGRVVIGSDRAGDTVVGGPGSAVGRLLEQDGDRRGRTTTSRTCSDAIGFLSFLRCGTAKRRSTTVAAERLDAGSELSVMLKTRTRAPSRDVFTAHAGSGRPADHASVVAQVSAAASMSWVTSAGWATMATWLEGTSMVVAPMRLANRRSASGGIAWSCVATRYHEGRDFQAGTPITSVNVEPARGCCAACITLAWTGSTSAAKCLT